MKDSVCHIWADREHKNWCMTKLAACLLLKIIWLVSLLFGGGMGWLGSKDGSSKARLTRRGHFDVKNLLDPGVEVVR